MKRINIISILFLVFILASCKKDPMQDANHLTDNAVLITLAIPENKPLTRADDVHTDTDVNSDDEKRIASATVLFYDHTTQLLIKKVSTGADGISWDHVLQRVVIPSGKLDLKKTYDIVVLANLPEASSLVGTITEGDNRAALSNLYSKITSPITVDQTHPLMMSGMKENHSFSTNKSAQVALIHQAVKIRVNISLTDEFAALGADALFKAATTPVRLTLFNVPNFSYLIGAGVFNDLAKQAGYALLDYSPVEMPRSAALNQWSKTIYAYENVVDGVSSDHQKRATSFVFQLPYKASGVEVSENYYKVMIEDPNTASEAATKYKTERNHLYDVNVKVKGFGSA
ncbi:MAG: fimbrial protein, partial [Rikenellaceae bacterium]